MDTAPKAIVPVSAGLIEDQKTEIDCDPVGVVKGAEGSELEKESEPKSAGALPLGVTCKLKASASMLVLPLKLSVTGMLKLAPGAPDPPPAETVPSDCARTEGGAKHRNMRQRRFIQTGDADRPENPSLLLSSKSRTTERDGGILPDRIKDATPIAPELSPGRPA